MNFQKMLIAIAVVVVAIVSYQFLTRIDRGNPAAVANAFTKAMKAKDTEAAAKFYVPAEAQAWRTGVDEYVGKLKSATKESYYERIPSDPGFTAPVTVAGKNSMVSSDSSYTLEMMQVDGKWYVSKAPL